MHIILPKDVLYILDELEHHGHRADVVGGPVRDFLLGKVPDDFDITTSASPSETKAIFSHLRTVDTGIKHGTVSVILGGAQYEITTYRIDGEYKDSRHPESVIFTKKIEEDLRRRDFTMNAIAYNPKRGLTDPYGGIEDTSSGVIRAVGEAELRFTEDALRILRGARFAATLGFSVEKKTAAAMLKTRHLLGKVSVERIYVELRKMLSGSYSYDAIKSFADIILEVIPELDSLVLPERQLYESADFVPRLIALFYLNSENPKESLDSALRRLHTDSHIRDICSAVIPLIDFERCDSDISLAHLLRKIGEESARILVDTRILLALSDISARQRLASLLEKGCVYKLSDININGKALIRLGARGKEIGNILEVLLSEVIEGITENTEQALMTSAKAHLAESEKHQKTE